MGHKLLLADDSTTIQKVVSIIFSGDEYELTVVDNGTDALARARESLPDVMLVDAVMPGIDGYAVCRAVRDDPRLTFVPILLLTGVFDSFDETAAVAAGADDVIPKPFEAQVLIDKVTELIAIGAGRRPALSPEVTPESAELSAGQDEPLVIEEVTAFQDPWGVAPAVEACPAENDSGESAGTDDGDEEFVSDLEELDVLSPADEGNRSLPAQTSGAAVPASDDLLAPPSGEPPPPAPEEFRHPVPEGLPPGAPAAEFTEEQLVAALSKISREVIERIVWEVVPDLAETLIREEIRKLREGV